MQRKVLIKDKTQKQLPECSAVRCGEPKAAVKHWNTTNMVLSNLLLLSLLGVGVCG